MANVLELLKTHEPAFQVQSGTSKLRSSEQFFSLSGSETADQERANHRLGYAVLNWLTSNVTDSMVTAETGGGWSTVVLGVCAKKHYCVNPDKTGNSLVSKFIAQHKLEAELVFLEDSSPYALPTAKFGESLDIVLIDGNHSFPFPIIDWFFLEPHMHEGSKLIGSVKNLSHFSFGGGFGHRLSG